MYNWFRNLMLHRIYKNNVSKAPKFENRKKTADLKTISVLLDHRLGVDKEIFKKMGEVFELPQKNIRVLSYYPSQKNIDKTDLNSSYSKKDISNWGMVNGVLNDFCSYKSDVLINFYNSNDIHLKYISSKTNRKLSIGFESVDHAINDLIIDVKVEDTDVFLNECIKYLKIFFICHK